MRVQGESVVKLNRWGASISGEGLYTSLSVDLRHSSGTFDLLSFPFQSFLPVTSPPRSRVSHARPFQQSSSQFLPLLLSALSIVPTHAGTLQTVHRDSPYRQTSRRTHEPLCDAYMTRFGPAPTIRDATRTFSQVHLDPRDLRAYNHSILVFRIRPSVIDMRHGSTAARPAVIFSLSRTSVARLPWTVVYSLPTRRAIDTTVGDRHASGLAHRVFNVHVFRCVCTSA